jgi:ATP-dependent helicase HrpB
MRAFDTALPIDAALPELAEALRRASARPNAVLVAPPGAGKTTRVPLALIDTPWAGGAHRKLIMLEPRRLAARGAAARMAATLGERVGDTVGLRVRLGSQVSARTRIEVVTEGVFARMILSDPTLDGVAGVIFDEFHERSLDADLGLALALDAQGALRPDLRILVMSATLDGARVARLLGDGTDAPVILSEGRAFPVETRYLGRDPQARIEDQMVDAIRHALAEETGSILAFLPGQAEILRTAERLSERVRDPSVVIAPLYGAMEMAAQDRAVKPAAAGFRKVVLATSIAETSLTIEGVRVVIDSGLARVPRYEPDVGVTRLVTVRAARAQVDQRRGRAGRTEPGVCYRLWEEAANGALEPFARPEILTADLAPLLLDCAAWGETDPTRLPFLDAPPRPALKEARALLVSLGAIDGDGRLTALGRHVSDLPLPPRLARMVVSAAGRGQAGEAARLAALLVERGLGGDGADLEARLTRFARDGACHTQDRRSDDMRRLADGWARQAQGAAGAAAARPRLSTGGLLALAYPDRIARARGRPGHYLLANGRAGQLEPHEALAKAPWIVVADLTGQAASARILAGAALGETDIEVEIAALAPDLPAGLLGEADETRFDPAAAALRRRATRKLGAITLAERNLPVEPGPQAALALAQGLATIGLSRLPWTKAQTRLRERFAFLHAADPAAWPDLGDAALAASVSDWLAPVLTGHVALADITADDLDAALALIAPWELARRAEAEAPSHFEAPTGSRVAVDYAAEAGPTVSIRVQELYGLTKHPTLAGGKVALVLELLSPAHRPIQVTRDLPGFWRGSWAAVRTEMKGRYPRHLWPEDPTQADPTTRAKPRGT